MAAKEMSTANGGYIKDFIGTAAEQSAVVTTYLAPGSTYWASDTKVGYVWDGSAWKAV